MRRLAAVALALAAAGATPPVHAALWGFVDGGGTAFVAVTPLDARFRPLLGAEARQRVAGKAEPSSGRLTWFDFAPEVKAVMPWLREASRLHGVDIELLKAMIAVESGFNVGAISPRGALGLMQLMPHSAARWATAKEALRPAEERLLDARTNILTGARMLADLTRRYHGIEIALAAWNAGEGTVRRAGGRMPDIDETRAHVQQVLVLYRALLQHNQSRRAVRLELL